MSYEQDSLKRQLDIRQIAGGCGSTSYNPSNLKPCTEAPESISAALNEQDNLLSELVGTLNECFERMNTYLAPPAKEPSCDSAKTVAPVRILDRVYDHNRILRDTIAGLRDLRNRFQA